MIEYYPDLIFCFSPIGRDENRSIIAGTGPSEERKKIGQRILKIFKNEENSTAEPNKNMVREGVRGVAGVATATPIFQVLFYI